MKKLLLLLILSIPSYLFGQIEFAKGYFTNEEGKRIECFIKDLGWQNNPTSFSYKLTEDGPIATGKIGTVSEFAMGSRTKFVRYSLKIDRSSENLKKVNSNRQPIWSDETIFLKVLIEGKATLFKYREEGLLRFFISYDGGLPEQLVYKAFYASPGKMAYNRLYLTQLQNSLKCESVPTEITIPYRESALYKHFVDYNKCAGSTFKELDSENRPDWNMRITSGFSISSYTLSAPSLFNIYNGSFGPAPTLRIGGELEIIIPYKKNKWAIFLEPCYRQFRKEYQEGSISYKLDYASVELPMAVRHYFFLNQKSRIFINGAYVFDFALNATVKTSNTTFDIKANPNYLIGVGYQRERLSVELRYYTSRNILGSYILRIANDFNNSSLIIGYKLF